MRQGGGRGANRLAATDSRREFQGRPRINSKAQVTTRQWLLTAAVCSVEEAGKGRQRQKVKDHFSFLVLADKNVGQTVKE